MFTQHFWKNALERSIKTFAQVLAGLITADGTGILDVDWPQALSVAGLSALASVLTSIGSVPFGRPDSPSLADD